MSPVDDDGGRLVNAKALRAYLLRYAAVARPGWCPTRVSDEIVRALDESLRTVARRMVDQHPSTGTTIKQHL